MGIMALSSKQKYTKDVNGPKVAPTNIAKIYRARSYAAIPLKLSRSTCAGEVGESKTRGTQKKKHGNLSCDPVNLSGEKPSGTKSDRNSRAATANLGTQCTQERPSFKHRWDLKGIS